MITNTNIRTSKSVTDPETRFEVFIKHWMYTMKTISKENPTLDESEPVIYYMEEMVALLIEEKCTSTDNVIGPIFQYSLDQDIFNKIYNWSGKCFGDILEKVKQQQLSLFEAIVSQGHPSILHHRELLQPLLKLLNGYSLRSSHRLEISLVKLLKLISVRVSNDPILQSLCTEIGLTKLLDPLPLLNPLVPFLYREGILGHEAKDAVIHLLALSINNEDVACSVSLQSDFCPVLATGLSALYSALPRKLPVFCHSVLLGQLNKATISKIPELQHFLEYLDFCCEVNEVTHPLIREAVLHYIYNGFLLPVIGPSLNQTSLDEVIAATIYFDLFLRNITESGILKAFLCFTIAESHDGYRILESLISRMNSNTGLGVATLSLMNTLLSFNCEDIMFELVFKHLIPYYHSNVKSNDSIGEKRALPEVCDALHRLHFDFFDPQFVLDSDLLEKTRNLILQRNVACESSWRFDYNELNPSVHYMEKVMDPTFVHTHKPFHGFLDHYSQLLEMRDACKRNSLTSFVHPRKPSSSNSSITNDLSGSCHFTPRSQLSRSNSVDTITSVRFEMDSELDKCLYRLRYPSEEDLLEQKSRYMISYNIINDFSNISLDSMTIASQTALKSCKDEINNKKFSEAFDLATSISSDSQESITNDFEINMDEIHSLVNCTELEEFLILLNNIQVTPEALKLCEFSLDNVLKYAPFEEDLCRENVDENKTPSPVGSIMSLQSAITIEDNMLKDTLQYDKVQRNLYVKKVITVGQFLYTILDRLESFQSNPFQINLLLTSLIVSLLSFPQPLLRNYLLDTSESWSNGFKSLYSVLKCLKEKIDETKTRINILKGDDNFFQNLCFEAKSRLERRLTLLEKGEFECDEILSICGCLQSSESDVILKRTFKSPKKNFNLMEFLSRRPIRNENQANNFLNFNRKSNKEDIELSKQLTAAYSTIILDNFFHEIVAFSKEYSVHMQSFSFNF